jgi:hypothetical protein
VECAEDAVLPTLPTVVAFCSGLPQVLILHADEDAYAADVQNGLFATGAFSAVNVYNATYSTPTLVELSAYDGVLVYSNYGWADATALGNNLAAYVDAGGGVVTAIFAVSGESYGWIGGAFSTNTYEVIVPGSVTYGPQLSLGMIHQPAHPLLAGVTNFDGDTQVTDLVLPR